MTVYPLSTDKTGRIFNIRLTNFINRQQGYFLFITLTELRQLITCKGLGAIYYGGVLKRDF